MRSDSPPVELGLWSFDNSMIRRLASGTKSTLVQEISMEVFSWNSNLNTCSAKGLHEQVLFLYRKMRAAGAHPNASTFPSLLKSCAVLSTLQLGEGIHSHIIRYGCEPDQCVGSALVHLYMKCRRIETALKVFDEMPSRNVVSWTALIQGYARSGSFNRAVDMFMQMQIVDGVSPNAVTIMSLLPVCPSLGFGQCLHTRSIKMGLDSDSLAATSLVSMYLKCEAVENASWVFDGLCDKNDVSWLVMVSGLAQNGFVEDAVLLVGRMLLDLNLVLDSTALVNLVSACTLAEDLQCGNWVHIYVIKTGMELDAFAGTALVNLYAKFGFLELSHQVFKGISEPNLVSWNSIMYSYARQGFLEEFIVLFRQLIQAGLSPDSVTIRSYLLVLASSSGRGESQFGDCIHAFSIKSGFLDSEIATANSLLDYYAKVGDIQSAEALFSCIDDRRDTITWNCMICAYVHNGFANEAIALFRRMQWVCLVPDSFSFSSVLAACACLGDRLLGSCMHAYLIRQGHSLRLDTYVRTALVDVYAKSGDVASAYRIFEETRVQDTATWNAMIVGFSQNGYAYEALALFYRHLKNTEGSVLPDSAVATAVSTCGQLGSLEGGQSLHGYILRKGLASDVKVKNAILNMYSKCGAVEDARSLFEMMVQKDTTSWTTMISGYGINGRANDVVSLFEEMMAKKKKPEECVEPNGVTFLEVLWACGHGGLVKEGWDYFERMTRIYNIKARPEHFCCLVDLLGRGGYLYEAYLLIRSLKVKVDAPIWGALLGACRAYGELELGQIAGEELLRAAESNSGYRVLLSNAYAGGGWWDHSARVREEVTMEGLHNKLPGWSCIEVRC